jgi:tellurite resistance protein
VKAAPPEAGRRCFNGFTKHQDLAMDLQSSGALLRILNLVAMADGECSLEEDHLLKSLTKQHKLQAQTLAGLDDLADANDMAALAAKIAPEHDLLTMKTATMVASIARGRNDNSFINSQEDERLKTLAAALSLTAEAITKARTEAEEQLCQQPSLWQVLYSCFGSQFERPILI